MVRVIDPGHHYLLEELDGGPGFEIIFLKRQGPGYPGNSGEHSGPTMQEYARALLDRVRYVDAQQPCAENVEAIWHLERFILCLERRAASRHGVTLSVDDHRMIDTIETCGICGHISCRHQTVLGRIGAGVEQDG